MRPAALAALLLLGGCYRPEQATPPIIDYVVTFRGDAIDLDASGRSVLDAAAATAGAHPDASLRVVGFADPARAAESVQIHSRLRAQAVADALLAHGIGKARLELRYHTAYGADPGVESRRVDIVFRR